MLICVCLIMVTVALSGCNNSQSDTSKSSSTESVAGTTVSTTAATDETVETFPSADNTPGYGAAEEFDD